MMQRLPALLFALVVLASPASSDTLRVAGAGSLTESFSDLLRRFPAGSDTVAAAEFGPSGLMREKIETGLDIDLFASADMEQARRLAAGHPDRMVINFTRNHLCAVAHVADGLTRDNMLDRLLDPRVRLATSTPRADPAGDYAWAVFARADAVRPGARAALEAKALQLYGGGAKTPTFFLGKGPVEGIFLTDRADVALGYCSAGPTILHEVPGLSVVPLPPDLAVGAEYGMVLLNTKPLTLRFAAFVMSEGGQAVMKAHGFDPVALVEPVPPPPGLIVHRAGRVARVMPFASLVELKSITQSTNVVTERGEQQREWSGPLLWDVLVAAGAVEPNDPVAQIRLAVRVTGADGFAAVFSVGELSPQFAGRPVQLANRLNGALVPEQALRLIVPGERRAARSVRDILRIDVE